MGWDPFIFCECLHASLTWWNLNPHKYSLTKRSLMFCLDVSMPAWYDGGLGLFPYMLQSQFKDPHVSTRLDLQLEIYIKYWKIRGTMHCLVSSKNRWTIDDVYRRLIEWQLKWCICTFGRRQLLTSQQFPLIEMVKFTHFPKHLSDTTTPHQHLVAPLLEVGDVHFS